MLDKFPKQHDYLIVFDSDGCIFDTAEIKVKECFVPNIIRCFELQAAAKYVREASEFVLLYSQTRGINRFHALVRILDLLSEWPAVQRRGVRIPDREPLRGWLAREPKPSNTTLEAEVTRTGDPALARALTWSQAANQTIRELVHGVLPFPYVRESLEAVSKWADILVSSTTPHEALVREWREHRIDQFPALIAGQELGTKTEHIRRASAGRYDAKRILMLGDAPGDHAAATANNAHFFPILPNLEEESWQTFLTSAAESFRSGNYPASYESALESALPETPRWKQTPSQNSSIVDRKS